MQPESRNAAVAQGRGLAIAVVGGGVVLGLCAVAVRVAAGLDIQDAAMIASQVHEHGRLAGARSAVLAFWSLALLATGVHGFIGANGRSVLVRVGASSAAIAVVALLEGLWITAALCAVVALAAVALRRAYQPEPALHS